MLLSMTGYGKAVAKYNEKTIHVEVKSLNSKAMDCSTRIAPIYREKEMDIRKRIQESAVRGKIDFAIWVEKDISTDAPQVNIPLAKSYYQQMQDLSGELGIPMPAPNALDVMQVLVRMPDVVSRAEIEELTDEEWAVASAAIDEALKELTAFRIQEGAALRKKFEEKLDNITRLMESIEPYESSRVEKIRQRITDGLTAIPDVEYDKNRLEQEMIYYIEKLDISEEKQRLTNHLKYFRETMDEPWEPVSCGGKSQGIGKKLGFIAQEMGREINTTGSKSNQAEMQNIVVQMKDELEQIKEQVLNAL
ncbi:MAG: YicC family protein [Prevotella sp.]|nr:YicC family protein [Prevotella sp.]